MALTAPGGLGTAASQCCGTPVGAAGGILLPWGSTFGIGNVSIASCLGQIVTPTCLTGEVPPVSLGSASISLCAGMSELPKDAEHWCDCKTPCLLKAELLSSRNMKKHEVLP